MRGSERALGSRWIYRFVAVLALFVSAPAMANPVIAWNEAVGQIIQADHAAPAAGGPHGAAPMFRSPNTARAQVALAIFEAVNAIDPRYRSYLDMPPGSRLASQRAAIAAAAHAVLVELFPARRGALDASLAMDLAAVPDGQAETDGIAVGRAAAARVLARTLQPAGASIPNYRPRTSPGVYVPTDLPILPMSAYVRTPWVLVNTGEFNAPPPPALTSERYTRDWDEVRRLGSRHSTDRTPAQTAAASFWDTHDFTGMLRQFASAPRRSAVENARFYALLAMAIDDAGTAITVAKYDHGLWRPITAIRNAEDDANAATSPVPDWQPLLRTPLHPEYPCGHCIFAAVTAEVVAMEFGRRPAGGLTFRNPAFPGAAWTVAMTDEYAQAVADSRIYAGAHYRFSNEAAQEMGRRIARATFERALRTVRDRR